MNRMTRNEALEVAARDFAWITGDDSFIILNIEPNHQDAWAWDVVARWPGDEFDTRATVWREGDSEYCEW